MFEGLRSKFPNFASYEDKELEELLRKKGVKSAQVFGEKALVQINLERQTHGGQTVWEALSRFPAKDSH